MIYWYVHTAIRLAIEYPSIIIGIGSNNNPLQLKIIYTSISTQSSIIIIQIFRTIDNSKGGHWLVATYTCCLFVP